MVAYMFRTRLRQELVLALTALLFCAVGCGGSPASPPPPSYSNMTGNWKFTAVSQKIAGARGLGSASLTQSGTSISGTYNTSGGCSNTSPITGSVIGNSLSLQIDENGQVASLTGTVNSAFTAMSGNFTSPSGGCTNGDFGTWSGTRQ
jgi:hypothetical protein